MHIDTSKTKWKVFIDGRQLKRKERFEITCESCNTQFHTTTRTMESKQSPYKCKICVRYREPANKLKAGPMARIDKQAFRAYDGDDNHIAIKKKIEIQCVGCNESYVNSMSFEKQKLNPWHCRSCARLLDYQREDYRANRKDTAKAMWESEEYRANQRVRPNSWFGKGGYHNGIWFRSQLEIEYVKAFERHSIEYQYEPTRFELDSGKGYIIDFYLPSLDMYVEIKGRYADKTDKYYQWKSSQGKLVKSVILYDNTLHTFIRSKNGQNFIKEEYRRQASL
jgi:hypothetical protein